MVVPFEHELHHSLFNHQHHGNQNLSQLIVVPPSSLHPFRFMGTLYHFRNKAEDMADDTSWFVKFN